MKSKLKIVDYVNNSAGKGDFLNPDVVKLQKENKRIVLENEALKFELSKKKLLDEALRESGQRFRDIVFSMAGWIWETDRHGNYIYSSDAVEFILDYEPAEIIGKNMAEFLGVDKKSEFLELISKNKLINDLEWWTKNRKEERICVSVTGVPIKNSNESSDGYRGVIKDVTLRKQAEEKLTELNKELSRSNNDLEQFAYFASHDLREPLRMVSEFLSLLEKRYKKVLDNDGKNFIDFALQGADRMQRMIEGLLDFARVNTHGQKFKLIDSDKILNKVLYDLQFLIEDTNTKIFRDKLPLVFGDSNQLASLFQNLITNSIKFRKSEKSTIWINTEKTINFWKFSFSDDGIGFNMKESDKIFCLFESLQNTNQSKGNGIGLALCKRIVERHGGKIWTESAVNNGTTIFFNIPINK